MKRATHIALELDLNETLARQVLQLAREADVYMPIVEQVKMVLDGTMNPRDIAPHLPTDDDTPQGERTNLGEADRGGALWRAIERALDQFRHGGRSTDRD